MSTQPPSRSSSSPSAAALPVRGHLDYTCLFYTILIATGYTLNATIPVGSTSQVRVSKAGMSNVTITEGSITVWECVESIDR